MNLTDFTDVKRKPNTLDATQVAFDTPVKHKSKSATTITSGKYEYFAYIFVTNYT